MEAANLGALPGRSARRRARRGGGRAGRGAGVPALGRRLAARPPSRCSSGRRDRTTRSGIPTWHYGHEPPNVFATAIAKYFRNATREAILLEVCDAGIVFLPGRGGTVQEVFQDACENYYADESSVAADGARRPDVLDRDPAGLAAAAARWPAAGRWRTTSTSSTPSRRPMPGCRRTLRIPDERSDGYRAVIGVRARAGAACGSARVPGADRPSVHRRSRRRPASRAMTSAARRPRLTSNMSASSTGETGTWPGAR